MKMLRMESLEDRRPLAVVDVWFGPDGFNPNVMGTIGRTIVADAKSPECEQRCLVAIDAIDESITLIGNYQSLNTHASVEQSDRIILDTMQGIIETDGTPEGTRTLPGDRGTLIESDGRAYWAASKHDSGLLRIDVWNTDGIISQFAAPIGECSDFDGCDFSKMIGVVHGEAYFQQSVYPTMYVYRNDQLLFEQPHIDVAYYPLYEARELEGIPILFYETPMRRGILTEQGSPLLEHLREVVYADDDSRLWYNEEDGEEWEYQPSVGSTPVVDIWEMVARYDEEHPEEEFGVELPNLLDFNQSYGYAVMAYSSPETGAELEIWHAMVGDSNIDGIFDSADLVLVFQAGLYESNQVATWDTGDWDHDGFCTSADLVLAFQIGAYI